MNPNQRHFSRIKASDIIELDANEPASSTGLIRQTLRLGVCTEVFIGAAPCSVCDAVHSNYATVLASLADSNLPPDQNAAMFYNRYVIDDNYGGLALEEEGNRCAQLLADPRHKVMIMGNHGILVIGSTIAETFNRLYYFEGRWKLHPVVTD